MYVCVWACQAGGPIVRRPHLMSTTLTETDCLAQGNQMGGWGWRWGWRGGGVEKACTCNKVILRKIARENRGVRYVYFNYFILSALHLHIKDHKKCK